MLMSTGAPRMLRKMQSLMSRLEQATIRNAILLNPLTLLVRSLDLPVTIVDCIIIDLRTVVGRNSSMTPVILRTHILTNLPAPLVGCLVMMLLSVAGIFVRIVVMLVILLMTVRSVYLGTLALSCVLLKLKIKVSCS